MGKSDFWGNPDVQDAVRYREANRDDDKPGASSILGFIRKDSDESFYFHRLHIVYLIEKGLGEDEVAEMFGIETQTAKRWHNAFKEKGFEGVENIRPGKTPKVDDRTLEDAFQDMKNDGYEQKDWTGKLLKNYLSKYHDTEMSVRQCQRLLKNKRQQSK